MKSIKLFLIVVSFVLTNIFTFSCSNDNDNDDNPVVVSSSSGQNKSSSSSSVLDIENSSSSQNTDISSSSEQVEVSSSSMDLVIDISSSSEQNNSFSSSSSLDIENSSSSSEQGVSSSSSTNLVIDISSSSSESNNGWELYYIKSEDDLTMSNRFIINLEDFEGWTPDKAEFFTEQKMYFENTELITMMACQPRDGVKIKWDESTASKVPFDGTEEPLEGGDAIKHWGLGEDGKSIWIRFSTAGYPIPLKLIKKNEL